MSPAAVLPPSSLYNNVDPALWPTYSLWYRGQIMHQPARRSDVRYKSEQRPLYRDGVRICGMIPNQPRANGQPMATVSDDGIRCFVGRLVGPDSTEEV